MRTYFKYNPSPFYVLEITGYKEGDEYKNMKEVKGNTYLLPNTKTPHASGVFPTYVIGEKLTKEELFELKNKYGKDPLFDLPKRKD